MTLLHCFATPFGVGNTVLLANVTTIFTVVEMLTPFCDEQ